MPAHAYARGHLIVSFTLNDWRYFDSGRPFDDSRSCKKCGKNQTTEGFDACLGHIEGAEHACCGHGVDHPYTMYPDKSRIGV